MQAPDRSPDATTVSDDLLHQLDPLPRNEDDLRRELAQAKARIRELEQLAHIDELTGVLNRRGFTERGFKFAQLEELLGKVRSGEVKAVVVLHDGEFSSARIIARATRGNTAVAPTVRPHP